MILLTKKVFDLSPRHDLSSADNGMTSPGYMIMWRVIYLNLGERSQLNALCVSHSQFMPTKRQFCVIKVQMGLSESKI